MAMYRYVKAAPRQPMRRPVIVSYGLMVLGMAILLWTLWPILSFTALSDTLFAKTISPVAEASVPSSGSFGSFSDNTIPRALIPGSPIDYSNANIWFPTSPQKKVVTPVNAYRLSIPRLGIDRATVTIAGDDLNTSLVHYGGTPLPGQLGNAVIFGHSTLPQFFNPRNYKTIFSTVPTLKKGDEIIAEVDGIQYKYIVYDMVVVEPTDLSPLEQRFDEYVMTVVTCVPPGTYWKRLNVKARLEKNS